MMHQNQVRLWTRRTKENVSQRILWAEEALKIYRKKEQNARIISLEHNLAREIERKKQYQKQHLSVPDIKKELTEDNIYWRQAPFTEQDSTPEQDEKNSSI